MGASVFFESASELARLTNTFTVADAPADPTTVTLTVTSPSGAVSTYTYGAAQITKDSTGVYHKDVTCSEAGEWQYQWVGTGTATDTTVGTFTVQEATLGRLYAPVQALKSRLGISDAVDDYELHAACFAASRAIEQHTRRIFYRTAVNTARTFVANDAYSLLLPEFNDLVSISEVATDSGDGTFATVWPVSAYQLLPYNAAAAPEPLPYQELRVAGSALWPLSTGTLRANLIRVTGVWGWPAVPQSIKQAALILAQETFKAKDTFGGVAGFGEFGVVRLQQNPLLHMYLKPYVRLEGFA